MRSVPTSIANLDLRPVLADDPWDVTWDWPEVPDVAKKHVIYVTVIANIREFNAQLDKTRALLQAASFGWVEDIVATENEVPFRYGWFVAIAIALVLWAILAIGAWWLWL